MSLYCMRFKKNKFNNNHYYIFINIRRTVKYSLFHSDSKSNWYMGNMMSEQKFKF